MPKHTIHIQNDQCTVKDMRRQLAQVLSKLDGENNISFTFSAKLDNYRPTVVYGELARPEND
jgi:hypothetical protein